MSETVLVTGGAGYVGTVLSPLLAQLGHEVRVLDTFWFGDHLPDHPNLTKIRGHIRDVALVENMLDGVDSVIHLACLSNDISCELDQDVTREINFDAGVALIQAAKGEGVRRFVYASTSSVYGIKSVEKVTEDLALEPSTLYSILKADLENVLFEAGSDDFTVVAVRSATVCGYSPRMRLDLLLNIMTASAVQRGVIRVDGGQQTRALIHVSDIIRFYASLLTAPHEKIQHEAFNVNYGNYRVIEVAEMVREVIPCEIRFGKQVDTRSYHLNSEKAERVLGFKATTSIRSAILEIADACRDGRIDIDNDIHYNIRWLKQHGIDMVKV